MRAFVLCLLLAGMWLAPAAAQTPRAPTAERAAFQQLIARYPGRWSCEIKEYDATGKVLWSDTQIRVFELMFMGRALEERAYKAPRLERAENFGLHMLSLDDRTGEAFQLGVWPGAATRLFEVTGRVRPDATGIEGTMNGRTEDGGTMQVRVFIGWTGANTHVYRAYAKDAAGKEFLKEELVYTRLPG